jgi:hypothetical protein
LWAVVAQEVLRHYLLDHLEVERLVAVVAVVVRQ